MLPNQQEKLSSLLGMLYEAAADASLWDPFIEELAKHTKATSGALLMHDFEHAKYSLSSSWQMRPESVRLYQDHYHKLDVWVQRALTLPPGSVCSSQFLCTLREMRTKEIYNDFMVQAGIEHGMFTMLENNKFRLASVSLYRDRSCAKFTQSNLQVLQYLASHLQRAFDLYFRLSELKAHIAGLETALNLLPTGVVFLGTSGEVILMNRSASACVAERDGLLATRLGLQAKHPQESSLLSRSIREAAATSNGSGDSPGRIMFVSRRDRPPLELLVSPIHNSFIQTSKHAAVAVFITDPLRAPRPTQAMLQTIYGLTPAECRVALLLRDALAPRQIADKVGVTENTVRSQIKSIFSKTGVRRQGELIRLLLSGEMGRECARD